LVLFENKGEAMIAPVDTADHSIPPMMPDRVDRSRLLERLDQGIRRKLTLISAPAGFGKTTLIAAWAHKLRARGNKRLRIAWLSLDESDNDPINFLHHFIASLQTIDAMIGQTARPFLETPHVPKLDYMMQLLADDLNAVGEQSFLVLDDFHTLNRPELQTAIEFFLHHLPAQCHLILLTRDEPSLSLARLRKLWEGTEILLKDLRFSVEETETFLNQTMGLEVTAEAAQTLGNRTEGWVAGLQMAALTLRGRRVTPDSSVKIWEIDPVNGGRLHIIDQLATEVLDQQSAEIQTFLRQTAIISRFNASLCDAVTGRSDSVAMLSLLEKANLFLIPLDNERQWYRYHHLFADFLRGRLIEGEQTELHRRASHWYETHGMITGAIRHSLAASEPMNAVRLIRDYSQETLRNGGFATLRTWVSSLPEEIIREHSDMAVCKGWVLCARGEIAASETYAQLAMEIQRPDEPLDQRGKLLSFRSFLALNRRDPVEAVKFAREALDLLSNDSAFHHITALTHLGQAQRLAGDRDGAIQTLQKATVLGQRSGNHLIALEALAYLATLLSQRGDLSEALLMCEQAANRYLDAKGDPLPVAGLICVSLGVLYYQVNDLDRALASLSKGLSLCRHMGILDRALVGQCTLAKLYFARGESDAMRNALSLARRLASRSENQRKNRLVDVVTADLQLRNGQVPAATLTLANFPALETDRTEQENLTFARWLLAHGKIEESLGLLQRLKSVAEQQRRRRGLITIHLLLAIAYNLNRDSTEEFESLEAAIRLAEPEGYLRPFLDEGPAVAAMLPQNRPTAPAFVDRLLEAFSKLPSKDASRTAAALTPSRQTTERPPVERLTKTQLEVLRLVADGLSNREIADKLDITEGTTKWHLNQIYSKFNVGSRTQAIVEARKHNLL
jgi:LuxR family maltose regulon positive regulatory protein